MTAAELLQRKAQLLMQCAEGSSAQGELQEFANGYLERAAELINLPGPSENHEAISERVKKQLRDKHGRWIKMHSEVTVHSPFSGETFTGKVTSIDPENNQVHVKLDDVTASVPVDPKNIEAVQAVLHHDNGTTQTLAEHVAQGHPEAKPYSFIQHSTHAQPDGSVIHRVSAKDASGQTYAQMEFDHNGKAVHAAGAHGPQGQEAFKDIREHADKHIFPPLADWEKELLGQHHAPGEPAFDATGWKKIGGQGGSNPGGTFEDPAGERWYIKDASTPTHAKNEALASAMYGDLGVNVPEVQVATKDGKTVIASKLVPGAKSDLETKLSDPAYKTELQNGFVADSWLANWDVAGLVYDNVVTGSDGKPWRIDTGGSLLYRAMGTPKNSLFGDTVGEIETLRDPSMNPTSADVFNGLTDEQIKSQVKHLVSTMTDAKIADLVHAQAFEPNAENELTTTLKNRRDYLANKYGVTSADVEKDMPPEGTPTLLAIQDGVFADTLKAGDSYYGIVKYGPSGGVPNGSIYHVDVVDNFGAGLIVFHVTDEHGNNDIHEVNDAIMWKAPSGTKPWDPQIATGSDAAPGLSTAPPDNEPFQLGYANQKIQVGHKVKSLTDLNTGTVVKLESNGLYVKIKMDYDGKIKGRKTSTLTLVKEPQPVAQTPSPAAPSTPTESAASIEHPNAGYYKHNENGGELHVHPDGSVTSTDANGNVHQYEAGTHAAKFLIGTIQLKTSKWTHVAAPSDQPSPDGSKVDSPPAPVPPKPTLPMDMASVHQRINQALYDGENHDVTSHDLNPFDLLDDLHAQNGDYITVKPPGGYETNLRRADVEALVKDAGLAPPPAPPAPPVSSIPFLPAGHILHPDDQVKSGLLNTIVLHNDGTAHVYSKTGTVFIAVGTPEFASPYYNKSHIENPDAQIADNGGFPPYVQQSQIKPGDSFYKNADGAIMAVHADGTAHVFHADGVVGKVGTTNKKYLDSDKNKHWLPFSPGGPSSVTAPPAAPTAMKDMYGKDTKVGDLVEVEYKDSEGYLTSELGHVTHVVDGKATVDVGGDIMHDLPSDQVALINASTADHPNEPPQLVEPPKTETYTPKPGEKSVFGNGNVPIYKGSKVKSLSDGLEGTVTVIEANGQYVKVKGTDGKIRGRKRTTLQVTAHPNGAAPNHADALNGISITDTSPKVDAVPAELQKYVGQPAPQQPAAPKIEKGSFVPDTWIQAVKDRYAQFSPGKSIESSKNWERVQSVLNSGDLSDLQHLLTRSYIDQAMFDQAKALIETKQQHDANLLAQHNQDLKAWQQEALLWNKANGVKGGIFDPENFTLSGMDGARDWASAAAGTQWAKKTWPDSKFYSSSQFSAINSYAGTSSGFNPTLWKMKESSLIPTLLPQKIKNLDSAMEAAPRVPEDIIVRRGVSMNQFVGRDGVRLAHYGGGANIQDIKGTVQVHWGFTSTSVATSAAMSGGVQMKIRVPKGYKAIYMHANGLSMHSSEYELLLDRGGHFYIHDVKQVNGHWVVDAELVPQGWPPDASIPVLAGARFA